MAIKIPKPTRPLMAGTYGLSEDTEGMLSWVWVEEQLTQARNYWISTTRPNGKPHAAPVWGIWMDTTLYFGSDRKSAKSRNLAHNPAVNMHLESGDEVVIIEGLVEEVPNQAIPAAFYKSYTQKYNFDPSQQPSENGIYYKLNLEIVLAWLENDFAKTAARWDFRSV